MDLRVPDDPELARRLEAIFARLSWMRHDDAEAAKALARLLAGLPSILKDIYGAQLPQLLEKGDTMTPAELEEWVEDLKFNFQHVDFLIHRDKKFLL